MIILNIIQNVALLIACAAVYQVIGSRFAKKNVGHQILSGLLFGSAGIIGMMTPLNFAPGIIFDGRSIILSVSGLFGGPVVAAVAATMCGSYRLWLGGGGAWVGVCVIVESAALGVVFYFLWKGAVRQITWFSLYTFGLLVHVIMLAMFLGLPGGVGTEVLRQIGLPIVALYPLATMLIGLMFRGYERQTKDRKELKEREQFLSAIVENIPDMIFVKDAKELRFVRFNRAGEDILGYSREELIGKSDYDFFPKEEADFFTAKDREILETDAPTEIHEETIQTRHRGERILHTKKIPLHDEQGISQYVLGISEDITDRKRADAEIRDRDHFLRSILLATPVGLLFTENRVIKWGNPAAERMFGFRDASEYVGQPTSILYQSAERYAGARKQVYNGLAHSEVGETVADFIRADGSLFQGYLRTIYVDASIPSKGTVSAIADLTEIAQAKQAHREAQDLYRSLFQNSKDAVFVTSRDGRFLEVNESFCDLFGYDQNELRFLEARQAYANPADREFFQEAIEKTGSVKDFPLQLCKKHSEVFEALITASVRYGESGEILGYQGILRDMTETRRLERQLLQAQKIESIGTLAGGIAHDFNNLLQVIIGYSDLLLFHKKREDPDHEALYSIRKAGRDGSELAKRILTFSQKLEPNARPIDLNNEIQRVQKMLKRTVPRMIQIELRPADRLMTVNADPGQMEQVLLNLAVNAQHAMPEGGRLTIETANVTLDKEYCSTHVDTEPGEYVLMMVSDTGHGMDRETVEHIFEPFFTTKGPGEGTGLGLAMVYGIVKSHKGHVSCYSEPGLGTTFKIYLPAIVQDIEEDVATTQQILAFGTETVLLVDDEIPIRKIGEQFLRMAGYTILTAADGYEALEVYRANQDKIDLVLLDLVMPKMGGKQCLAELLRINPKVKVVIASGYSEKGRAKLEIEEQTKGFIRKPYDMREILVVVRRVLDE